jgi:hypothetical protein
MVASPALRIVIVTVLEVDDVSATVAINGSLLLYVIAPPPDTEDVAFVNVNDAVVNENIAGVVTEFEGYALLSPKLIVGIVSPILCYTLYKQKKNMKKYEKI